MNHLHYTLDGHTPVLCQDVSVWALWYEGADRHVAKTQDGGILVSTVFLGMDHSFGGGPPLLFETMVFGSPLDQECERCTTWEEAEEQHREMVRRVTVAVLEANTSRLLEAGE